MTTIRRTTLQQQHNHRRSGGGGGGGGGGVLSKCVLLGGLVALVILVLNLVAIFVLHQRDYSSSQQPPMMKQQHASSLTQILEKSRQGLGEKNQPPKAPTMLRHEKGKKQEEEEEDSEKVATTNDQQPDEADALQDQDPAEDESDQARDPREDAWNEAGAGGNEEQQHEEEDVELVRVSEESETVARESTDDKGTTRATTTDRAYIVDFAKERQGSAFRKKDLSLPKTVRSELESLEACEYIEDNSRIVSRAACHENHHHQQITVYNSQSFPRSWCGNVIAPNSIQRLEEPCYEPVRLFPNDPPPVSGQGMPPIVIKKSDQQQSSFKVEDVECNVPCRQQVDMTGTTTTRYIEGTDWKIFQIPGDPLNTRDAEIDLTAFRRDEYYSTASFRSSVPLSSFSFEHYNFTVPAVNFDDTLPSASYLVDNTCNPARGSKRHRWSGGVANHYNVTNYASCAHNTDIPDGMSLEKREDRIKLHSKHRFNLAFESSSEKDYITDLIWDAFQSGSLPVILGPTNVEDHFPPNSFINVGQFQHFDDLGKYIKTVGENKTLWESYHAWRQKPNVWQSFQERYNFTRTEPTCRMCRWAYAKKYGLGWDHVQQIVREPAATRSMCVDTETSLLASPFYESYVRKSTNGTYSSSATTRAKDSSSCDGHANALRGVFDSDGSHVERSIQAHDGVTDLVIEQINRSKQQQQDDSKVILRLEFDVKNVDGAHFPNPHILVSTNRGPLHTSVAIQDDQSKVTVVANWDTEMVSVREGTIEIVLHSNSDGDVRRRIRVITEDTSYLHDKLTEYFPSSFAKLMIKDFVDPLEVFTGKQS